MSGLFNPKSEIRNLKSGCFIVDTNPLAPLECGSRAWGQLVSYQPVRGSRIMSLVKIIIITIAVILSILFFGRFLF